MNYFMPSIRLGGGRCFSVGLVVFVVSSYHTFVPFFPPFLIEIKPRNGPARASKS